MGSTTNHALALVLALMAVTTPSGQPSDNQASDFKGAGASRVVTWQTKRVTPPSHLYVDLDDQMIVAGISHLAGETVTVNYRLLRAADGVIVRGQITLALPSANTLVLQTAPLAEGFLISVSCKASIAQTRGHTWVRIFLGAGAYGQGQPSNMLMADYVTNAMAPTHPNGRVLTPVEGPGWIHSINQNSPAAGVDFGMTSIPIGRYRVISLTASLTTSAQVATRVPLFVVLGDLLQVEQVYQAVQGQTASIFFRYTLSAAPQNAALAPGGAIQVGLPPLMILKGPESIESVTTNLQTGDQWSGISLLTEEWFDDV